MALSQFGGRPGSGSGSASAGKEIGEVFLVPQTYNSADVVDAGETIVNADYPLLYPKLVNGSVTNNFVTRTWPLSDGAITNVRVAASAHHNGATYIVTWDGKVASSQDGNTWTARGSLASPTDANFPLLWSTQITNATTSKPLIAMYSTGSRLVVINYNCRYGAGFYTDNNGGTWTAFSDATINTVLTVSTTAIGFMGTTTGAAVMVDIISKKIYRAANGITGWVDVTGSAVIPVSTATPSVYSDASTTWFWIGNTAFTSLDNGLTFTSSTFTAAAAPSSIVRWGGALYCILYSSTTQPIYKSVDNGATWTASGTVVTASSTWSVLVPGSDGNIGAVSFSNCYKSTDGATWTSTGSLVPVLNTTYNYDAFLVKNAGTGYTAVFPSKCGSATRTTSGSYGAPWTIANPIWFTGIDIPGIWAMDIATSPSGVTVIPCNPPTPETARGNSQAHTTFLNTNYSALSNVAYVGNWTTGFQVATLPVLDVWHGITYNAAAGLFILTGSTTDAVYTSADGLTWNTIPLGSLPQSAKLCTPRTAGPITYFIPYAAATVALMMFVVRPDGTSYYTKTAYTSAAWQLTTPDNAVEILDGVVSTGTSIVRSWFVDPRILTSTTGTGVTVPLQPTSWASTTGYNVVHKNYAVGRPSASGVNSTAIFGDKFNNTPPVVNVSTSAADNVRNVALLQKAGVLYLYQSGKTVRTSTDFGVTWTTATNLTSISTDEAGIVIGKTFGDGIVVMFGNRGTYIYDSTSTGSDPLSKTLNNGWTAPTGLKYVVKAK